MNRNKTNMLIILTLCFFLIFLILFYNRHITINFLQSKKSVEIYANFIFDNKETFLSCNQNDIINLNLKQYSVIFDNIKYPHPSVPLYMNKSIDFNCLNEIITSTSLSKPIILFWNEVGMFGNKQLTDECPVKHCELTHDKTRLYESDLVVSHMVDKIDEMPANYARPWHQRWVFFLLESPVHSHNYEKYNGVFNLSSTYKIDSDFNVSKLNHYIGLFKNF